MRAFVGALALLALLAASASAASPSPIATGASMAREIAIIPNATGTTAATLNMSVDCSAPSVGWTALSVAAEVKPIDPAISATVTPASASVPFRGCGVVHTIPLQLGVSAARPMRSALVLYANVTATCATACATSGLGGTARVLAIVARDAPVLPTPSPALPTPPSSSSSTPTTTSTTAAPRAPITWLPWTIGALGLAAAGGGFLALRPKSGASGKARAPIPRGYDAARSLSPNVWLATDRASGERVVLARMSKERAKLFRGLEHPNLARVLDVRGDFVIAEDVQGEPVDAHDRVARALAYLEAQGITGIDPDLHEILQCEDGIVRLAATCFASNTGRR